MAEYAGAMPRESRVEARLVSGAKKLGGAAYKLNPANNAGAPDRVVAIPGRDAFFVELKTAGGRLSKRQTLHYDRLRMQGKNVFVPRSVEDVDALLTAAANRYADDFYNLQIASDRLVSGRYIAALLTGPGVP